MAYFDQAGIPYFSSADYCQSPQAYFEAMHSLNAPFCSEEDGRWYVCRYRHVQSVLHDSRLSKLLPPSAEGSDVLGKSMAFQDPPRHTALRSLISDDFSGRKLESLKNKWRKTANKLIDGFIGNRTVDFVAGFAIPFPGLVVADFLGVPEQALSDICKWSSTITTGSQMAGASEAERHSAVSEAYQSLLAYLGSLIASVGPVSDSPTMSLSSKLSLAESQGVVSRDEAVSMLALLVIGGHETTSNLLANGMLSLLAHPHQYQLLSNSPKLLPSAIEEMLRYETPLQMSTYRCTTEDVTINGVTIPNGVEVVALLGAANRDPEVFPEPNKFDIRRPPNRHIAFGHGIHSCIGQALARMEAEVAFEQFFRRIKNVHFGPAPKSKRTKFKELTSVFMARSLQRQLPLAGNWHQASHMRTLVDLPVHW